MTATFINAWAEFVVRKRILVLAVSLLLLPIYLFSMRTITFDASNEMWFLKDDPSLAQYEFLKETFGSAQAILIGIPKRQGEDSVITAEILVILDYGDELGYLLWLLCVDLFSPFFMSVLAFVILRRYDEGSCFWLA